MSRPPSAAGMLPGLGLGHGIGLALVLALVLADGCGLRTPVRPPEDTAPVIPGRPLVERDEHGAVVRWKRADESADGQPLVDLAAFVVERRQGDGPWQAVATIDVVDQDKFRRRRDFSWRDEAPPPAASYRVHAVCTDGQAGPTAEAE